MTKRHDGMFPTFRPTRSLAPYLPLPLPLPICMDENGGSDVANDGGFAGTARMRNGLAELHRSVNAAAVPATRSQWSRTVFVVCSLCSSGWGRSPP